MGKATFSLTSSPLPDVFQTLDSRVQLEKAILIVKFVLLNLVRTFSYTLNIVTVL